MSAVSTPPSMPVPSHRVTPEEMLRLPDGGKLYELVDGELREKPMSDRAQLVANRVKRLLDRWSDLTDAGTTLVESTFQCFPHAPEMVRRPDVAFITAARLAGYQVGHGHFRIAPDLAVEVVSPRDEVYELDRKIRDYFRAGVRRVWVINPEQETLRIHRGPGDIAELLGDSQLSDPVILPGFECRLPVIFAMPAAPAT